MFRVVPSLVDLEWEPENAGFGGRRARLRFTYQAYVPDPIADLDVPLSVDIVEILSEADRGIAALNVGPSTLGSFEVLARQLLRSESVASSRIEGLQLSHRRLARASWGGPRDDVIASSVLGNVAAMQAAIGLGSQRRFGPAELRALHRTLFDATRDARLGGKVRTVQNWIGGAADSPRGAEFVPPPADLVAALLDDLCEFIRRDDVPAIVQAAIAHAQFETIHPFAEGNGRVGRCLVHLILRRRGIAPHYVPPISLVLASDAPAYVAGLTAFRRGDVAGWCALFAAATRTAARGAATFATDVAALQAAWRAQAGQPRADATVHRLIDALPGTPVLDVTTAERLAGTSNQAARLAMAALEAAGILRRINVGRRNRAWEAPALFDLVEAFEDRLSTPPRRPARKPRSKPSTRR